MQMNNFGWLEICGWQEIQKAVHPIESATPSSFFFQQVSSGKVKLKVLKEQTQGNVASIWKLLSKYESLGF